LAKLGWEAAGRGGLGPPWRGARRRRLGAIGWALAVVLAVGCNAEPSRTVPEHLPHALVLVTLDTTRADHLSAYGYERRTSPTLEEIAAGGARFTRAIAPMPTTDPSHLSLLTGLYPRTHGVWANGIELPDPTRPNLAAWARAQGYRTGAFISRAHLTPSRLALEGFEAEDGPDGHVRDGAATLEAATEWLDDIGGDSFFVWVHLFDPHWPYRSPEEFAARFDAPEDPEPLHMKNEVGRPRYSEEAIDALVRSYDAAIAYTDHLVGEFLEQMDDRVPRGEAALVVVVADHGENLGELDERMGYAFDHSDLVYQGTLAVPFLIHWPERVPANVVVDQVVEHVDLAPTLFDLLGETGFPTQGRSHAPAIAGETSAESGLAVTQRRIPRGQFAEDPGAVEQFAVQDRRSKLIVSLPSLRTELFDLEKDPLERNDLSAERPAERDRLLRAFHDWTERTPIAPNLSSEIPADKIEALRALGYIE
jgi:arylsulfatase A-like enzyme